MMTKRYWLFKSEPGCFSIDDLSKRKQQTEPWDGVRNYQARNMLRDDIKKGDELFFYHSNAGQIGIAGICTVSRGGYPDHTARDPQSDHFDPKSTTENPRWYMVDVKVKQKLPRVLLLAELKETRGLEEMVVCQRGSRLSIQPVTAKEWQIVGRMIKKL